MPSSTAVTVVQNQNMRWEWTRIALDPDRKFLTLANSPSLERSPVLGSEAHPVGAFMHWMAPSNAAAWRAEAIRARDAQLAAGTRHVDGMVKAVAAFYNDLNIRWYLHRAARELYWQYLSGRPTTDTFTRDANSVRGWYKPGKIFPIVTGDSKGTIPAFARRIYRSKRPDVAANEFVQTVGIGLGVNVCRNEGRKDELLASRHTDAWYLEDEAINQAFCVGTLGPMTSGSGIDAPGSTIFTECTPLALPFVQNPLRMPGQGWPYESNSDVKDLQDANALPAGTDTPDSFRGDFGFRLDDSVTMKMSLGPDHYFQWLSDWIDLLSTQTFAEIVTSAREMTVYFNEKVLAGGRGLAGILAASAEQYSQSVTMDPSLRLAETAIGAAGAALATATYGISAVVAGVVTLGIEIGTAIKGPDVEAIRSNRDDLGRFKPVLETPWLGGSSASGAADNIPRFVIPNPVGAPSSTDILTNPTVAMFRHDYSPTPGSRTVTPTNAPGDDRKPEEDKGMGTGGKVLIGAAFLGTLAKLAGIF